MPKCKILAALLLTTTAGHVIASPAGWQSHLEAAQNAIAFGAEKPVIFIMSDPGLPLGLQVEAGRFSLGRGYIPGSLNGKAPLKMAATWDVSPILSYDNNLNGGAKKGSFEVSGLRFLIPEDQQRKAGLVIGAEALAETRYAMGYQTVADIGAFARYVWSPEHKIGKYGVGANGCLTRQVERDFYLGACVSYASYKDDLNHEDNAAFDLSATKILGDAEAIHSLTAGLSLVHSIDRQWDTSYDQVRGRLAGETYFPDGQRLTYQIMAGEKVEGDNVKTFGADISWVKIVKWGSVSAGASYSEFSGAMWLGQDANESERSVFAGFRSKKGLEFEVQYVDTASESPINNGNEVFFDINYKF